MSMPSIACSIPVYKALPADVRKDPVQADADMAALNIQPHAILKIWNYTIRPRTDSRSSAQLRELID